MYVLPSGADPTAELTDSRTSGTEVPPGRLPALAFCLLFRFQGAFALAHSAEADSVPPLCQPALGRVGTLLTGEHAHNLVRKKS